MNISPHTSPTLRPPARPERGLALISVLLLVAVLAVITVLSFSLTLRETRTSKLSAQSLRGFYAAEAGLNKRASDVRRKFNGYELPIGTGPTTATPCSATDQGSGDLACQTLTAFTARSVGTYVKNLTRDPVNGDPGVVEAGSPFAGMNYLQFNYRVYSQAQSTAGSTAGQTEARTQMEFQSRLIPIFQFAAFSQGTMEIGPGKPFVLHGRVHSNGDLYFGSDDPYNPSGFSATITSGFPTTITAAGNFSATRHNVPGQLYNSRAQVGTKPWGVNKPYLTPLSEAEKASLLPDAISGVAPLVVPPLSSLKQSPNSDFWKYADLRVVAVSSGLPGVYTLVARNADGSVNANNTGLLSACNVLGNNGNDKLVGNGKRVVDYITVSSTLYDGRESRYITTLNVDQTSLMQCIAAGRFVRDNGTSLTIDDASNGGLVIHLSIDNPAASGPGFGVRITNAQTLGDFREGVTRPKGVTFVSDQPVYLQGDFNALQKIPAAVMGDTISVLSAAWNDTKSPISSLPVATQTTINAGLISGTDQTIPDVRDGGGLQNYMRLHEDWNNTVLTYRGSLISLGTPQHSIGAWCQGAPCYTAPTRNFDYDTSFDVAANLPPLTPNIVYLKQLVFSRQYQ